MADRHKLGNRFAIAVAFVAIAVSVVAYIYWPALKVIRNSEAANTPDPPEPDPRLTYPTPYRNVKPGVAYVGDDACAVCHKEICTSYHKHPMGRSAERIDPKSMTEKWGANGRTEFVSGPFTLASEKTATGLRHRLRLTDSPDRLEADLPVSVAIGSGTRGKSYLAVEHGFVWQTPVSWFGPDEKWDLSPGFRIGRTLRRPIAGACLYCHTDSVDPVTGSSNRYREPLFPRQVAIGCERCHGPGELHVAERGRELTAPAMDTSIVNPRHLSPALQLAVCEQCHLQGQERVNRRGRDLFEYRPGLPFDWFVSVFVRHPDIADGNKSVGQFEQMEQSQCFSKSNGRMVCTSCHDPHVAPKSDGKNAFYRQKCLNCHQKPESKGCSALPADRAGQSDNCVTCHMPKAASSNITHASVTNHRIMKMPISSQTTRPFPFGTVPLVRFRPGIGVPTEELDRDLGIALARYAKTIPPQLIAVRGDPRSAAVGRLKSSLVRWPGDAEAWEALAESRNERLEAVEKLKAARHAVELAPRSESAIAILAESATSAGEFELALQAAGEWIALNPASSDPLTARAFIYLKQGIWAKCEADCRAALAINPLHNETHLYLAICLHQQGDRNGGEMEARTAADLEPNPREKAYLIDWYRRATR